MDSMDQAAMLRAAFPSYGPAWEEAIDYGIDVSMLTDFFAMDPEDRLRRSLSPRELKPEGLTTDTSELLRRLVAARVEFVVVGGVAARTYGSAMGTDDLDIAAPFTVENLRRVLDAVGGLHPRYAMTVDKRPLTQSAKDLSSYKNLYLLTDLGRLDILGSVEPIGDYSTVAARAETLSVLGMELRVISLDDLIAVKAHVGRPKDRHMELELRAIRELKAAKR